MANTRKVDCKKLINHMFGQYAHNEVVLKRAVRNCQHPDILAYLKKTLAQEPRWKNQYNIIWAIVFNKELMNCKLCNKALPFENIQKNYPYCSAACQKADKGVQEAQVQVVKKAEEQAAQAAQAAEEAKKAQEEAKKKEGFFAKVKKFFSWKKKKKEE